MTTNPIPVKAALEFLGLASARLRLPLVAADAEQRAAVKAALEGSAFRSPADNFKQRVRFPVPSKKLRVLPLGGLGEIGKNMTVIEYDGKIVVVDTGLMFPTAEMHGIDLVLPDFSYLRDRADDIEAIVLTHGHEDHVGALPYVLREIGIAAGHLRRPADDRHGPLEARRAQARRQGAAAGAAGGGEGEARARSRSSWSTSPTRSLTCAASCSPPSSARC